jgi:hypothetical protein
MARLRLYRKQAGLAATVLLLTGGSLALAQARRPGERDTTISSTGQPIPAEDDWGGPTGPSSPNSQGVAGNPNRVERYETRPSGADFPQGTAAPTERSGNDPNARLEPAPMNR